MDLLFFRTDHSLIIRVFDGKLFEFMHLSTKSRKTPVYSLVLLTKICIAVDKENGLNPEI